MKNKFLYLIIILVVIATTVVVSPIISKMDFYSLFNNVMPHKSKSNGASVEMTTAEKGVKDTISELESYRSHLSENCIYSAAMILNDLGYDAEQVIEDDRKCIHTLVMSVIRDRQFKITEKRLAEIQREADELAESPSKDTNSEPDKSEQN